MATAGGSAQASGSQGLDRTIRFCGFLVSAVVALAFGLSELATASSILLECASNELGCNYGVHSVIYDQFLPGFVAGAVMVGVGIVLFVLAYRGR